MEGKLFPEYKMLKYNIISKNDNLVKLFNSIFDKITKALEEVYDPRKPFRIEINVTTELSTIEDSRLKAIMYEAITETIKDFGWVVKVQFNEDLEELIYIQRHK